MSNYPCIIFRVSSVGIGSDVQGVARATPWDFDNLRFIFNNLLNQTIKRRQKQN